MKNNIINLIKKQLLKLDITEDNIIVEIPKNPENGDYTTNIAMKLAKKLNKSPIEVANIIIEDINEAYIKKVEVVNPGFINFFLDKKYLVDNIKNVLNNQDDYGKSDIGNNLKINIEFVSANPTGILHIGNARGGAYGDSLARIMSFAGYDVTKEYYMNDAGNQINRLGNSILSRYMQLKDSDYPFFDGGYPGQEIKDIAQNIYQENDNYTEEDLEIFKDEGVKYLSKEIFNDLQEYRINYDVVTSERGIYKKYPIENVLKLMDEKGYLYQKDGATWFKSSELYDDNDHVLIKADGIYTYVVPDIPYHIDKIKRGYTKIIDVLGTDHHGYIARLKSGVKACGYDADIIEAKLMQLVRIVKNGEVQVMHKRSGNVVTLRDLINEVGVNAARFYFSRYSLDTQMDFDIELAKKKTNENPLYYINYAYARTCSILNKYENEIKCPEEFCYINSDAAYNVLGAIYNFPEVVKSAALKHMPHLITNYAYDLATLFHGYYEKCRIITDDIVETNENMCLLQCVKTTLKNALNLIGVEPDERM